jgi:alpha-galactosidase
MKLDPKIIGVQSSAKLHDLWEHKDLGLINEEFSAMVPKHGVVLLKVSR